jgi:DNA-directed RNA polymerase subunit F
MLGEIVTLAKPQIEYATDGSAMSAQQIEDLKDELIGIQKNVNFVLFNSAEVLVNKI